MKQEVLLGYEVGSGSPVSIPIGHMAVTGQSQQAGKTTALEGLIVRSGAAAVTFITKRGEGAFQGGRSLAPFFRERADWVFVASLIDATLGEKNKLLRSWLMRVCRNTETLAQVHRNVKAAQAEARGFAESIYTEIDGYLDLVVPQLRQLPPVSKVEIGPGLNVMDLSAYSSELQALVISSVLEHIYEHETGVITVIPEAWEFLPEGRGGPVKRSAEALVRKGAALRNFLWVDSQDLAGVMKLAVRACPVFLIGVQREANEIKRTLANIPAGVSKPSAADIATLELGQFYACWGRRAVKTYAQPAWLGASSAIEVASGRVPASDVWQTFRPPVAGIKVGHSKPVEVRVTKDEAARLTRENEQLKTTNARLLERIEALERHSAAAPEAAPARRASAPAASVAVAAGDDDQFEALYQRIHARLLEDRPALLAFTQSVPAIEMRVSRKVITVEEHSMKGRIARLLKERFFTSPRGCGAVRSALKKTGPDANTANIGRVLDDFKRDGFVIEEGGGYQEVPGMLVNVIEE